MKKILLLLSIILCGTFSAQNFYDPTVIQKIEITFLQSNWDYQMDTAKAGKEGYIMADQVKINGVIFDSVGVKYKGNSSYNPTYIKNPLHIELDAFKNQSYLGMKTVKLGNNYADPSMIREVLGYNILKNYMHCSQSNFAKVYVNGVYFGVYSNTESINGKFNSNNYFSSNNTEIKCNPIVNPSPNTKCNLKYFTTGDSSNYFNYYEIKSNYGWNALRTLCDTITNFPNKASTNIDMDRVIWMLAFNNVLVNLDSYSGAFCQNYYLYKDNTQHYNPTIWDLNMCFGGFPYLGNSNSSLLQQTINGLQQMPINIHATDVYWPLINIVNNNAQYKRMLVAHMRTISNEFFANNTYTAIAQQYQTLIDTSVLSDTYKFYSYSNFQNGLTSNVSVGSYSVPGISNLMSARISYLQSTLDFGYTPPTISNVLASNASPIINTTIAITASVINTSTVYLGSRTSNHLKFTRTQMFDDGLHQDGVAGDNVYGASIVVASAETEYYIYAENTNAGMFSPQRAEHEFYSIQTNLPQPNVGDVVINEFLASNTFSQPDENGKHEDWIELYNNSNSVLNLSGLYLTDDYTNQTKYSFPANTIIQPHDYFTLWADEDNTNGDVLHCNFKLETLGEKIMLSKGTTVLDSITFGVQGADISIGRCPNGSGVFGPTFIPTFNYSNCQVGLNDFISSNQFGLFPNPTNDQLFITTTIEKEMSFEIYDTVGSLIYKNVLNKKSEINTSAFSSGIYFIKIGEDTFKFIVMH